MRRRARHLTRLCAAALGVVSLRSFASLRPPPLVRGVKDVSGTDAAHRHHVVRTAERLAGLHCYERIEPAILQHASVFLRALGSDTEVVEKQMFSCSPTHRGSDGGGATGDAPGNAPGDAAGNGNERSRQRIREEVVLRPESTAPVMRAYQSELRERSLPLRMYYHGPMFRYERPQSGRLREFHQVGVEVIGAEDATHDAEVIIFARQYLDSLGIRAKLKLNTLGSDDARSRYFADLEHYLNTCADELSATSRARLQRSSILRILDSKDKEDQEILNSDTLPNIRSYLSGSDAEHHERVINALRGAGVEFEEDHKLVRGLDYYNGTIFEFMHARVDDESEYAVLGGGRYDSLAAKMGGTDVKAVGWAAGIERLCLHAPLAEAEPCDVVGVVRVRSSGGDESEERALDRYCMSLLQQVRRRGVPAVGFLSPRKNVKKQMQAAAHAKCSTCIIVGGDEVRDGAVVVKDMHSKKQQRIPLCNLSDVL